MRTETFACATVVDVSLCVMKRREKDERNHEVHQPHLSMQRSCLRKPSARVCITQCQHPYILLICREPGIPQEKISRELCVNKSSVTRQITLMEEKGLIMRKQDPTDRRVWRVYPTQKMQELLPHVRLVMKEWNEYLLEGFSEEEQEKLVVALEKLMQRAQTAAQESLKGR